MENLDEQVKYLQRISKEAFSRAGIVAEFNTASSSIGICARSHRLNGSASYRAKEYLQTNARLDNKNIDLYILANNNNI